MCHIAQDRMPYITQNVNEAYYCVPTIEEGQWDDLSNWMGLVESSVGQEGPLMADPCSEEKMMSNDDKINDTGMSYRLELQEKANFDGSRLERYCTDVLLACLTKVRH